MKQKKSIVKQALIFFGLKCAEVVGIFLLIYGLYWLGHIDMGFNDNFNTAKIPVVFICIGLVNFVMCIAVGLIYKLFDMNWRWAGRLTR